MHILVTGASGFLGTALIEALFACGVRAVRCFVRPTSNTFALEQVALAYPECRLDYAVGNLTSFNDCRRALEGITVVLHAAAQMRGAPAAMVLNTVVASSRLLEALGQSTVERVVLLSSIALYGAPRSRQAALDENSPLESDWSKRDPYTQTKLWQESLFRQAREETGFELVVFRPGVIYGPQREEFPGRLGVKFGKCFWTMGPHNSLPLTYIENCASAVVYAGLQPGVAGDYNIVDDDLPTGAEYLAQYKKEVSDIASLSFPWWLTISLSKAVEGYSRLSHGQIPPALTPYKSRVMWYGARFDNSKLKATGWKQPVSTAQGLETTFRHWKRRHVLSAAADRLALAQGHAGAKS